MYQLKITPAGGTAEFHSITVPYMGIDNPVDGESASLFETARNNRINYKTGVRALGDKTRIIYRDTPASTREEAEIALTESTNPKDNFVQAIKVQPSSGNAYWVYGAKVINPLAMFEQRLKEDLPVFIYLSFQNSEVEPGKASRLTDDDLVDIHALMSNTLPIEEVIFDSNRITYRCKPTDAPECMAQVAELIRQFAVKVAGTRFTRVRPKVAY